VTLGALTENTLVVLAGIVVLLLIGTLVVSALGRLWSGQDFTELRLRVRTWWVMVAVFTVALLSSRLVSLAFLALVSVLAMREYLAIVPIRPADRPLVALAYAAVPAQYAWIALGAYETSMVFVPLYMLIAMSAGMVVIGDTRGLLRAIGTLNLGLVLNVFLLGHLGLFLALPDAGNPSGGSAGLLLYLVFLAQFSDVVQYAVGKMVGRRRVIPRVSPNKTWEGLIGGLVVTVVLAPTLAPWLTPLGRGEAVAAGVLIGLAGFVGDVTISALKRDIGVKDMGTLLPGHGGVLDRIDSLVFAGPLFFHFVRALHY